jgi:hypothetical protein
MDVALWNGHASIVRRGAARQQPDAGANDSSDSSDTHQLFTFFTFLDHSRAPSRMNRGYSPKGNVGK